MSKTARNYKNKKTKFLILCSGYMYMCTSILTKMKKTLHFLNKIWQTVKTEILAKMTVFELVWKKLWRKWGIWQCKSERFEETSPGFWRNRSEEENSWLAANSSQALHLRFNGVVKEDCQCNGSKVLNDRPETAQKSFVKKMAPYASKARTVCIFVTYLWSFHWDHFLAQIVHDKNRPCDIVRFWWGKMISLADTNLPGPLPKVIRLTLKFRQPQFPLKR